MPDTPDVPETVERLVADALPIAKKWRDWAQTRWDEKPHYEDPFSPKGMLTDCKAIITVAAALEFLSARLAEVEAELTYAQQADLVGREVCDDIATQRDEARARCAEMAGALNEIVQRDQRPKFAYDDDSRVIGSVDGPFASIARTALANMEKQDGN